MSVLNEINKILGIRDSYKAPDRLMDILYGDIKERDKVFKQFLELYDYDVSWDWFHEYFQEEHAERKSRKQDFTPESIAKVLSGVADMPDNSTIYEPTAGTGGILITNWNQTRMKSNPFTYRPSNYFHLVEELSDRTLPYLLFNLIIRGMNAVVIHGDTLTRESYGVFFIQNDGDDHMKYSSLNRMKYNEDTEKMFNVKFVEEKHKPILQSQSMPLRLTNPKKYKEQLDNDEKAYNVLALMLTGEKFKKHIKFTKQESYGGEQRQENLAKKYQTQQLELFEDVDDL